VKRRCKLAGREPAQGRISGTALTLALTIFCVFFAAPASGGQENPGIFEDFSSAEGWEDLYFPKIKEHTAYSLGTDEEVTFLMANSSASASAFMLRRDIDVYETPLLSWRWKTDNVYGKGDLRTKKGDDSPLRIYIMFRYDPGRAPAGMRLKYAMARLIYGEYPPHSSLNYIWASREPMGSVLENAYTDRSRMIVMRTGASDAGKWLEEEANILEDYRRVFGEDPPEKARIAVMNDSDDTGEAALSYMDYIRLTAFQ